MDRRNQPMGYHSHGLITPDTSHDGVPTSFGPMSSRHLPPPPALIIAPVDNLDNPLHYYQPRTMATAFSNDNHHDRAFAFSASPVAGSASDVFGSNGSTSAASHDNPKHTRSYQACEACRARKTKCIMGDPDNPDAGPCKKCARERKKCVFAATRKRTDKDKIKQGDEEMTNTHSKKRSSSDASLDAPAIQRTTPGFSSLNGLASPSGYGGTNLFPMSPILSSPGLYTTNMAPPRSVPQPPHDLGANSLARSRTPNLLKAENGVPGDGEFRSPLAAAVLSESVASSQQGMVLLLKAAGEAQGQSPSANDSPQSETRRSRTYSGIPGFGVGDIDYASLSATQASELKNALQVWSRMRYVRAGWFTGREAMTWIDKFYEFLQPLTPIALPDYRTASRHYELLTEEPVLALTILTIASRQFPLVGPASVSRSHNIHDKLWNALRGTIERLLWGQEQFGGGFCGAGAAPVRESETGQITWKGSLRTLGTIEALLLLTDWQPRALHFPPGDDEGYLVDTFGLDQPNDGSGKDDDDTAVALPFAAALEPAWRSDRMSWMLLALAQALSFELSVFSTRHDNCGHDHGKDSECARKRRLSRLVHTYVAQTSGRLGIKSMLSPHDDKDYAFDRDYVPDSTDLMQISWLELAQIMFDANVNIFASQKQTRDLTSSGGYKAQIDLLAPRLAKWKDSFDLNESNFHPIMRIVLTVEYEYARMFINSLGFNRVLELWRAKGPQVQPAVLVKITEENRGYINEVREASTNLVSAVLAGFAERTQLRNAAVRTYLRSFSGMVFTLKLFSLGNHEKVVRRSLNLLVRLADAMRSQYVDDVHISSMIANQVHALADSVLRSLIRIQKPHNGSHQSSREQSLRHSPPQGQESTNTAFNVHSGKGSKSNETSPDPLAIIEARPMADFSERAFMPPPSMGLGGDDGMDFDPNIDPNMQFDFSNTDWFTLPLDNVLAQNDLSLEPGMGGLGPSLGDKDLLDFLAPTPNNLSSGPGPNMNQWNGFNGSANGSNHNGRHNGYSGMNGF